MSKRQACNYPALWNSGFVGECATHLKVGECPIITGIDVKMGGGFYLSKPLAIISGNSGGDNATGFLAYGRINNAGVVIGLDIVSHGWHFTKRPTILFSGDFRYYRNQGDLNCSGHAWDDPDCMCSGLGIVSGYPYYENVTKIPPQCSWAYSYDDWVTRLNRGDWPNDCDGATIDLAATSSFGKCLMPSGSGLCVSSWASGWAGEDCANGTWKKSANYCNEKGSRATRKRCVGDWHIGSTVATCGTPIRQQWRKTDEYLDFGVCTKRGYKNVVAMKSWHGEQPFTLRLGCEDWPCASGENTYTVKYLTAEGVWTYDLVWTNTPDAPEYASSIRQGEVKASLYMKGVVGRYNGKVSIDTQKYSYDSTNWKSSNESQTFNIFNRCTQAVNGYTGQVGKEEGYNYTDYTKTDWGITSQKVSTTKTVNATEIYYRQETTYKHYVKRTNSAEGDLALQNPVSYVTHDYNLHIVETYTITLSSPYTTGMLHDDTNALLNRWDLTDDLRYPWKTSESEFLMPKVTYNEASPASPLDAISAGAILSADCTKNQTICNYKFARGGQAVRWTDCSTPQSWPMPSNTQISGFDQVGDYSMTCRNSLSNYSVLNSQRDGRVMGAPTGIGYYGAIDFCHENIEESCCNCNCDSFNNDIIHSFGTQIPFYHFTQIPNYKESKGIYFGAFTFINDYNSCYNVSCSDSVITPCISYDVLVKGKYAEIIQIDKPSRNFKLPCGIGSSGDYSYINSGDSYLISQIRNLPTNYYRNNCIAACNCGQPDGYPTTCYVCSGGSGWKGRWGDTTTQAKACSGATVISSGYSSSSEAFIIINGVLGANTTTGTYVNANLELINGPSFYTQDVYKVKSISGTSGLTLSGNFGMAATDIHGWVDFANEHDWFDNYPKGDFVIRFWNFPAYSDDEAHPSLPPNYIDPYMTEQTTTQHCVDWSPCDPSFVVIGPPGSPEATNTTRNLEFVTMADLTPKICGAKHNYLVQQWMTDPLWIKPSMPCCLYSGYDQTGCQTEEALRGDFEDTLGIPMTITHHWLEDEGDCLYDTEEYTFSNNGAVSINQYHYYPLRPFVEARTGLPAGFSNLVVITGCAFPDSGMYQYRACLTKSLLTSMNNDTYNFMNTYYNGNLCSLCLPPLAGTTYWGNYAPWLIASKQKTCIEEAYPPVTNPIG